MLNVFARFCSHVLWCLFRFEIIVDGCEHKLVIHDANLEDIGDYTVTINDVSSTAHLEIEGKIK